jgi:SAM-dependent methyltransferase
MQRPVSSSQGNRRTFDKYESGGAYHWKECDRRSRTFNPPLVARYQVVADRITDAAHVLEIGAGDGRLTALLAESGARVVGIEIDDTAVRLASSALWRMENCAIAQADCYKLPFPTEIFDVAVMADVIEHLDEPESALEEAARVLKPGGVLILTTPKWRPDRVWDVHHVHEFTPSEIGSCLKQFFERVDISYFWPLFWSNVYSSRIGWRALRVYARYFPNPFLKVGSREESFGQILAMCCNPTKNLIRKAEKPGSCTIYD